MEIITAHDTWLRDRGISEKICIEKGVYWNRQGQLVIPIRDKDGHVLFNKYRRSPMDNFSPKYTYDKGSQAYLFGAENVDYADTVIICEGELDALLITDYFSENHGVPSHVARKVVGVSSTGGCGTWEEGWNELIKNKQIFVCYDSDQPGIMGAVKVLNKLPTAKAMFLPKNIKLQPKDLTELYQKVYNPVDSTHTFSINLYEMMQEAESFCVPFGLVSAKQKKDLQKEWLDRLNQANKAKKDNYWIKTILEHINNLGVRIEDKKPKEFKDNGVLAVAKQYPIPSLIEFRNGKGNCLWHDDSTPSLAYYPKSNTVYCFACQKYADAVDVCMAKENLSFKDAIKRLTNQ